MEDNCPRLFSPVTIGSLRLRNRIVMAPMGTNYCCLTGHVTQRVIDYYEARALGGAGLICVEAATIEHERGSFGTRQLSIEHDHCVPGLSELAAAIKRHGARAMLQIFHTGREAHIANQRIQPIAPSPIRSLNPKLAAPHALSKDEVQDIIERFVDATERAHRAGFDGVELHAAHTYLICQFLSPLCNDRDDEYGGSLENRARMLLEIIVGIRQRLGVDFPLSVRLSADEFAEGGLRIEDTTQIARLLVSASADLISVSAGGYLTAKPVTSPPASYPKGYLLPLAAKIKQAVTAPVIGVGRINTPALAEAALREGNCDLVALGRALIADPEFANKAAASRSAEIRPCTGCMHCMRSLMDDRDLECGNNPTVGRERVMAVQSATDPRRVFVIGGGPAGMEAAAIAARRGHYVTLFERRAELGGQLIVAAKPPHKEDLVLLRDYYLRQVETTGVTVRLGESPDLTQIREKAPDVVVIATGSQPLLPDIPGIGGPNVVLAEDVLLGKKATGRRVVVIGGELVGCETAEHLALQGKQVTITRRSQQRIAAKMNAMVRRQLLERLTLLNVRMLIGLQYERIDEQGLHILTPDGNRELLVADTVVVAAGSSASRELAEILEGQVPELVVIGDANSPRRFNEAIREGMVAALEI